MNKTWRERLQETETATDEMVIQASSWQTCAVGEQHEKYPEVVVHKSGDECGKVGCHPKDEVLRDLSQKFYDYLKDGKDGHVMLAIELLDQIDNRVLELKREAYS